MKCFPSLAAQVLAFCLALPAFAADLKEAVSKLASAEAGESEAAREALLEAGYDAVPHLLDAWLNPDHPARGKAAGIMRERPFEFASWRLQQERKRVEPPKPPKQHPPGVMPSPDPSPLGWTEPKVEDACLGERWFEGDCDLGLQPFAVTRIERGEDGTGYRCRFFRILLEPDGSRRYLEESAELDESLAVRRYEAEQARDPGPEKPGAVPALETIQSVPGRKGLKQVTYAETKKDLVTSWSGRSQTHPAFAAAPAMPLLCAGLDFEVSRAYPLHVLDWAGERSPDIFYRGSIARDDPSKPVILKRESPGAPSALIEFKTEANGAICGFACSGRTYAPAASPEARLAYRTEYALWSLWVSFRRSPSSSQGPSGASVAGALSLGWPAWDDLVNRFGAASKNGRWDWLGALKPVVSKMVTDSEGLADGGGAMVLDVQKWWEGKRAKLFPWKAESACWQVGRHKVVDFQCLLPPGYGLRLIQEATDFRTHEIRGKAASSSLTFLVAAHPPQLPLFPGREAEETGPKGFRTGKTGTGLYWGEGRAGGATFRFETPDPFERCVFLGIARSLEY